MGANAAIIVLFGIACPAPCPVSDLARESLEREARRVLENRGFEVRSPPPEAIRPTTEAAPLEDVDPAERLGAERLVVMDLERGAVRVWVTHYLRGVEAAWSVNTVECGRTDRGGLDCPSLEASLLKGLRPRRARDVDLTAGLRSRARAISRCVQEEDLQPLALRFFGRVDLMLEARPDGKVHVSAIAPARVARGPLGACLRQAIEALRVGPFTGETMKMRIPVHF